MLTSCSWYVDVWGGVGWGILTSCSWYVDGWGVVGHVNKLAARQQSLGSSAVETLKKNMLQHVAAGC